MLEFEVATTIALELFSYDVLSKSLAAASSWVWSFKKEYSEEAAAQIYFAEYF
jgi:hypothetical protein